jgi:hypothetical protein
MKAGAAITFPPSPDTCLARPVDERTRTAEGGTRSRRERTSGNAPSARCIPKVWSVGELRRFCCP